MATYAVNQLHLVPLAELQPDPTQPRKYMDPVALEELTASVSQMGIIQPVVCRQDPATGLVYTVAGERRCAAARKAGLAAVPAVFIDGANYAEIALVENLLRQDLNPVEEAEALKRLMDDHAYPQDQLAAIIGKSQPTISESLSLNRLPKEIRDECRQDPAVPKNVLVVIARKKHDGHAAAQCGCRSVHDPGSSRAQQCKDHPAVLPGIESQSTEGLLQRDGGDRATKGRQPT